MIWQFLWSSGEKVRGLLVRAGGLMYVFMGRGVRTPWHGGFQFFIPCETWMASVIESWINFVLTFTREMLLKLSFHAGKTCKPALICMAVGVGSSEDVRGGDYVACVEWGIDSSMMYWWLHVPFRFQVTTRNMFLEHSLMVADLIRSDERVKQKAHLHLPTII